MSDRLTIERGVPRTSISVIPLGVEPPEDVPNGDRNLLLFLGTLLPYKNVETLVHGFALAHPQLRAGITLAIAGRDLDGQQKPLLEDVADRLGVAASVKLVGNVSDTELEALFANSLALIVPSHAEGFGLPVLEAMVRGVPVLVANRAALPEVVGDAGLIFEPDRPEQLARLLVAVTSDDALRHRLIDAGLARADFLSWERTGKEFIKLFDVLLRD